MPKWIPRDDEETRNWQREWVSEKLAQMFALADGDLSGRLARDICAQIATKFGPDDVLGPFLLKLVKNGRQQRGQRRGVKPRWTRASYWWLLLNYELLKRNEGRAAALEWIAQRAHISQREVATRVTAARKRLSITERAELQAIRSGK